MPLSSAAAAALKKVASGSTTTSSAEHIIILGGEIAGLSTARHLLGYTHQRRSIRIMFIDRNFVDNKSTDGPMKISKQNVLTSPHPLDAMAMYYELAHNSMDVSITVQRNLHAGHQSGVCFQ